MDSGVAISLAVSLLFVIGGKFYAEARNRLQCHFAFVEIKPDAGIQLVLECRNASSHQLEMEEVELTLDHRYLGEIIFKPSAKFDVTGWPTTGNFVVVPRESVRQIRMWFNPAEIHNPQTARKETAQYLLNKATELKFNVHVLYRGRSYDSGWIGGPERL
jgi:hypothetical protein